MHRKLCKCVARHFSPIYESRSNFEVVQKWVMGPSWCPSLFFCGSLIRADTGSCENVWKCFGLLVEVGHMTKWSVLSCNALFGSNFLRSLTSFLGSLIRTCTGSFANVFEGTSPLHIKVGEILRLLTNRSWVVVDACHSFFYMYCNLISWTKLNFWSYFNTISRH